MFGKKKKFVLSYVRGIKEVHGGRELRSWNQSAFGLFTEDSFHHACPLQMNFYAVDSVQCPYVCDFIACPFSLALKFCFQTQLVKCRFFFQHHYTCHSQITHVHALSNCLQQPHVVWEENNFKAFKAESVSSCQFFQQNTPPSVFRLLNVVFLRSCRTLLTACQALTLDYLCDVCGFLSNELHWHEIQYISCQPQAIAHVSRQSLDNHAAHINLIAGAFKCFH